MGSWFSSKKNTSTNSTSSPKQNNSSKTKSLKCKDILNKTLTINDEFKSFLFNYLINLLENSIKLDQHPQAISKMGTGKNPFFKRNIFTDPNLTTEQFKINSMNNPNLIYKFSLSVVLNENCGLNSEDIKTLNEYIEKSSLADIFKFLKEKNKNEESIELFRKLRYQVNQFLLTNKQELSNLGINKDALTIIISDQKEGFTSLFDPTGKNNTKRYKLNRETARGKGYGTAGHTTQYTTTQKLIQELYSKPILENNINILKNKKPNQQSAGKKRKYKKN